MVSSWRSEKRRCPHFFFVRCTLELTKNARGRHIHTKVPRPFDFNNEVTVHFALKLLAVRGLKDEKVKELETRGPARVLLNGAWVSSTSPSSWRAKFLSASPASWLAKVHLKAQAQHGLLNKMASLRRARLARENPWKAGASAVEGGSARVRMSLLRARGPKISALAM